VSTAELPDFVAHCVDLLGDLGAIAARRMFGGWGLYVQGCMFALIADDVLYLKVDAQNQPLFEAQGLQPFTYETRGKRHMMGYFQPPESAMEDSTEMRPWARSSADAAFRAAAKARPRKAAQTESKRLEKRPNSTKKLAKAKH
jgi:DNA transformation protein